MWISNGNFNSIRAYNFDTKNYRIKYSHTAVILIDHAKVQLSISFYLQKFIRTRLRIVL